VKLSGGKKGEIWYMGYFNKPRKNLMLFEDIQRSWHWETRFVRLFCRKRSVIDHSPKHDVGDRSENPFSRIISLRLSIPSPFICTGQFSPKSPEEHGLRRLTSPYWIDRCGLDFSPFLWKINAIQTVAF
jgi:hypothetical protein